MQPSATHEQPDTDDHAVLPPIVPVPRRVPVPLRARAMSRREFGPPAVPVRARAALVVRPPPRELGPHLAAAPNIARRGLAAAEDVVGGGYRLEAGVALGGGDVPAGGRVRVVRADEVVVYRRAW